MYSTQCGFSRQLFCFSIKLRDHEKESVRPLGARWPYAEADFRYIRGGMLFDGTVLSVMNIGSNVLYISKALNAQILIDRTQVLFVIDDAFIAAKQSA